MREEGERSTKAFNGTEKAPLTVHSLWQKGSWPRYMGVPSTKSVQVGQSE